MRLPGLLATTATLAAGMGPPRRVLASLPWLEARAMARSMGFASRAEWDDYGCPGAYRLPKDPDVCWAEDWAGWDDWLGTMLPFDEARAAVQRCGLFGAAHYRELMRAGATSAAVERDAWSAGHAVRIREATADGGVDTGRLPAKPDVYYASEWAGWEDFLGFEAAGGGGAAGAAAPPAGGESRDLGR